MQLLSLPHYEWGKHWWYLSNTPKVWDHHWRFQLPEKGPALHTNHFPTLTSDITTSVALDYEPPLHFWRVTCIFPLGFMKVWDPITHSPLLYPLFPSFPEVKESSDRRAMKKDELWYNLGKNWFFIPQQSVSDVLIFRRHNLKTSDSKCKDIVIHVEMVRQKQRKPTHKESKFGKIFIVNYK